MTLNVAKARWLRGERVRVVLTRETVERLKALRRGGENYDSVIRRLLRHYEVRRLTGY